MTSAWLAVDVALLQVDALLREIEHLAVNLHVGDQVVIGGLGLGELAPWLDRKRKLERLAIDLEQLVAGLDLLAFLDDDLDRSCRRCRA